MRILFVDDERIIREGMKEIINWKKVNCTELVMAENASKAVKILESQNFDLVITDIYMQKMSGIEFAKYIKQIRPEIKVIILSAYENFGYAREAIEAGVFKYLLKPVKPSELEETIVEAMESINSQNTLLLQANESKKLANFYQTLLAKEFWKTILRNEIQDSQYIQRRMELYGVILPTIMLKCIVIGTKNTGFEIKEAVMPKIHNLAMNQLPTLINCTRMNRHRIAFVITGDIEQETLLRFIKSLEKMFCDSVMFAQGDSVEQIEQIYKSFDEAEMVLRFLETLSAHPDADGISTLDALPNSELFRAGIEKIIEDIQLGKLANKKHIEDYFAIIQDNILQVEQWIIAEAWLLFLIYENLNTQVLLQNRPFNMLLGDYLKNKTQSDKIQFIFSWIQQLIDLRKNSILSDTDKLVISAKSLIKKYLSDEQFSVNSIAEALHVSTSYLSREFRKKTGVTCIEYINKKRMEKAKNLLVNSDMKIQRIAQEVGYSNVYYFSAQFKRNTGETPSQYRKQMEDAHILID